MGTFEPITSADTLDPLKLLDIANDVTAKASAGAALTYAIYYAGKDFVLSMPDPVVRAYAQACAAFQIGRPR